MEKFICCGEIALNFFSLSLYLGQVHSKFALIDLIVGFLLLDFALSARLGLVEGRCFFNFFFE